jgi:hypothetical protein
MDEQRKEISAIFDAFITDFLTSGKPQAPYIQFASIMTRANYEAHRRLYCGEREHTSVPTLRKVLRNLGEDPDEIVISVFLREELPEGITLPNEYDGIRVLTETVRKR